MPSGMQLMEPAPTPTPHPTPPNPGPRPAGWVMAPWHASFVTTRTESNYPRSLCYAALMQCSCCALYRLRLDLDINSLTGTVPPNWPDVSTLKNISILLMNNDLTGNRPVRPDVTASPGLGGSQAALAVPAGQQLQPLQLWCNIRSPPPPTTRFWACTVWCSGFFMLAVHRGLLADTIYGP